MRTTMSRESIAELVIEAAVCIYRVAAVDPMYRHNKGVMDRALDFLNDLPWNRTRERTLDDLVQACAADPRHSNAPACLAQAVTDGYMGQKAAWHALQLAVGGFTPDLLAAYLGGPKPEWERNRWLMSP